MDLLNNQCMARRFKYWTRKTILGANAGIARRGLHDSRYRDYPDTEKYIYSLTTTSPFAWVAFSSSSSIHLLLVIRC